MRALQQPRARPVLAALLLIDESSRDFHVVEQVSPFRKHGYVVDELMPYLANHRVIGPRHDIGRAVDGEGMPLAAVLRALPVPRVGRGLS